MNIFHLILLSITICIDSFILCLLTKCKKKIYFFFIPFTFALFQVLFLYIGYILGSFLELYLKNYLKYIVFLIFSFMGLKLIIDAFINKNKEQEILDSISKIVIQGIITSCDSLFLGMPLAFNSNEYLIFLLIIGISTFFICFIALCFRNKINNKYDDKINMLGAIILFFFAFKSLI